MKCLVFRSLPALADARTIRMANLLKGLDVFVFTWERRKNQDGLKDGYSVVSFPLLKRTSFFRYALYCIWVTIIILFKANKNDIVIMMDLETAALGIVACRIKGAYSVFDVVDPFAETKVKSRMFRKSVIKLESNIIMNANLAIFPHESRIRYYKDELGADLICRNSLIIENVPFIVNTAIQSEKIAAIKRCKNNRIVIGYMGTLDASSRGIEFLIDFAKYYSEEVLVLFAGQGALEPMILKESRDNSNIFFWGGFEQSQLASIYEAIDFLWAFYSPSIWLHRYAAPNKYYEHLFFKKPIITSEVIPQSQSVLSNNSGIVLKYIESRNSCFDQLYGSLLKMKSSVLPGFCEDLWGREYANYYFDKRIELMNIITRSIKF